MKTFVGVLLLNLWSGLIFSQSLYPTAFQKGSILLGGDLAIGWGSSRMTGTDYEDYDFNTTGFTLAPKAALFLANGLALGIAVDYTANRFKEYDFDVSTTDFSIGPLMRIYTYDGFFIQSSFTFGKMTKGFDDTNIKKFNLGVGYAFAVSKLVFIEPVVLYRNSKLKFKDDELTLRANEFVIAVGLGVYLHKQQ